MRRTAEAENRTESITLRLEKRLLDQLREEAEKNLESVNVLGSHVLKFYLNWHSVAVDAGFMYFDKKNLSRILDKLTEDDIDQILDEYFNNEFLGRLKMLTGNTELDRFLRVYEAWMLGSGFRFRHMTNNGIQTYIIHHNVGKNAAYYFKRYFKKALEIMKAKDVEVKSTQDTLWVEFVT
jgi:hypothetical protein